MCQNLYSECDKFASKYEFVSIRLVGISWVFDLCRLQIWIFKSYQLSDTIYYCISNVVRWKIPLCVNYQIAPNISYYLCQLPNRVKYDTLNSFQSIFQETMCLSNIYRGSSIIILVMMDKLLQMTAGSLLLIFFCIDCMGKVCSRARLQFQSGW